MQKRISLIQVQGRSSVHGCNGFEGLTLVFMGFGYLGKAKADFSQMGFSWHCRIFTGWKWGIFGACRKTEVHQKNNFMKGWPWKKHGNRVYISSNILNHWYSKPCNRDFSSSRSAILVWPQIDSFWTPHLLIWGGRTAYLLEYHFTED